MLGVLDFPRAPIRTDQIGCNVEAVEPLEEQESQVSGTTLFHCAHQKQPGRFRVPCLVRGDPAMEQFLALALALGLRTTGTFDVRTRAAVAAFEERDARPDTDGFFVASGEIAIESGEEQFLDARLSLGIR